MRHPGSEYAVKLLRKNPGLTTAEAARILRKEHPLVYKSFDAAKNVVRYVRGTKGVEKRKKRANHEDSDLMVTPEKRNKYVLPVPPTAAKPREKVELNCPCTVLVLSDLHVPYHDPRAIQLAVQYAKKHHRVDTLLLNGDFCDFYGISRYDKDPSRMGFAAELKMQRKLLHSLKNAFPKAKRYFKIGNHEDRYQRFVNNRAPELFDVAEMSLENLLWLDKQSYELVDSHTPVMAGHLAIWHGHEFRTSSAVNPARAAFLKTFSACLFGHLHRSSNHCEPDVFHREIATWSTGCLCGLYPDYAPINKWNWGFAVVEVQRNKTFDVFNYRISPDYKVRAS